MSAPATIMPDLLYHGSTSRGITVLEPRKRFTPGSLGAEAPQVVHAGKTAAYAAAHAFPWTSRDGIDVVVEGDKVVLIVPAALKDRLEQGVVVYAAAAGPFALLDTEPKGYNFWTQEAVPVVQGDVYASVTEAVEKNSGEVRIVK